MPLYLVACLCEQGDYRYQFHYYNTLYLSESFKMLLHQQIGSELRQTSQYLYP